jgi:UDP-N-acetylglucosamine:LPS N-acetylglucosamine transferase
MKRRLFFGLDRTKKTVLAVGGSLGARSINEALAAHLDEFEKNDLQLIWQTGKTTASEYKHKGEGKENIWVGEFIKEMEMGYAAADIVISGQVPWRLRNYVLPENQRFLFLILWRQKITRHPMR